MADIKQQARELLANEWVRDSHNFTARLIRDGKLDGPEVPIGGTRDMDRAVRAIVAALESQSQAAAEHHAALQRIGTALGLPAGSDLHAECVPAIEALRAAAAVLAEVRREAARYRLLRANHQFAADNFGASAQVYFGTYQVGRLDESLDAEMATAPAPESRRDG